MIDLENIENEECLGCGWQFGDERHGEVDVWDYDDEANKTWRICIPCGLISHSWRSGNIPDKIHGHISQCANLILDAIRSTTAIDAGRG